MRADSLFTALQGGSAGEAVTRSTGRAGDGPDGTDAFATMLSRGQAEDMRPARAGRGERPSAAGTGGAMPVAEDGDATETRNAGATSGILDAEGPQVLPHAPPVIDRADEKDGTGPQILPGEQDRFERPDPPVLPHNPPASDPSKLKDRAGPQILPGGTTASGGGKGAQLPQINPGLPTGGAVTADDDINGPVADAAKATGQGAAGTPTDGEALIALPPAVMRRLLATHDARENGKTGESGRSTDKGAGAKVAPTGDATGPAPQGATSVAPSPGSSASSTPALSTARQGFRPTPDLTVAVAVPQGNSETPATPGSDAGAADLFSSALASADRGNGLSTLSRATVETTALIAAQIQNRLNGRSTRFEMALTPEGLGRVDVSLEIDRDGNLAARLAFDNPAAAADLRGRADELRRQLELAGLHLESDALLFTERDPSSGGHAFSGFDRKPFTRAAALNAETDGASAGAAVWQPLTLARDRVDLKV